jgi:lysophospholipase L1-like esterase
MGWKWSLRAGRLALALALLCLSTTPAMAQTSRLPWIAVWGASQQAPEPHNALPVESLDDATLRQVVRTTAGGARIRLRLTNAFGTAPLRIMSARVARAGSLGTSAIVAGSDQAVLFNGRPEAVVPPGADYLSDPIEMPVTAAEDIAVSLHVLQAGGAQTSHPGSRARTFVVAGDQTSAGAFETPTTIEHWYFLAGIEASGSGLDGAVAILGDSITDGFGVAADTNARWPDRLYARLQADPETRGLSVINLGTGGNRLLLDGLGPNALARLERDALSLPGLKHLIVLEGVNDLGVLTRDAPATPEAHAALVRDMIGAYRQIVERARSRGIGVIGATIMPYGSSGYYHPTPENEADRQAVNAWIRSEGAFDAVIDFDRIMGDPANPARLNRAYDSGDGLHPSMAGYRAMGDAVPLSLFRADHP